jgi:hypothetical protein
MAFLEGLTLAEVNKAILIENTSSTRFKQYFLITYDITTGQIEAEKTLSNDFPQGASLIFAYSDPGKKVIILTGERVVNGIFESESVSATFDVGFQPNQYLSYTKYPDQSSSYSDNYVIRGTTFSFDVIEENSATEPKTYIWNYGEGITFSGRTANTQIIRFDRVGPKTVGLTISNIFGENQSSITFFPISTPIFSISANPTFGDVRITRQIGLTASIVGLNGHLYGDINFTWQIDGQTYSGNAINHIFGSTGTKGVTLIYGSKILTGLSGSTYGQYVVLQEEFPLYYEPDLMVAFYKNEPEYAYYANEMKKYGSAYKYLSPRATGGYATCTYNATIATFEYFSDEEKAMPIMINAEYPWLEILYRKNSSELDSKWITDPTVVQEAQRQGVTLTGLTLAGYKEIAVRCWTDIVERMRNRGCPKMIHYASTAQAFSDYTGVPVGMLEYGPLPGVTETHYWYQANSVYNPTMRENFNTKINENSYGAMARAQSNADAHGAAAYCFVPNSARGICGISSWSSTDIVLRGYSGGTSFTNATDFTQAVLEDAVKVTSAKMWLEYYRACNESVSLGFMARRDMPQKIAPIVIYSIESIFLFANPGGGWRSRYKWHGSQNKDPEKTAENEIAAIFRTNSRIDYTTYDEIKLPDEIWIWDARRYYNLNIPSQFFDNPSVVTKDKVECWMMRNALEREFFGRPQLSSGNTLWYTASTGDNITYYRDNSLSNYFWNNISSVWWGFSGGTFTNMLPSPCKLDQTSSLAPWLNFNQTIFRNDVFKAINHKLSTDSLNYIIKAREKLNEIFR